MSTMSSEEQRNALARLIYRKGCHSGSDHILWCWAREFIGQTYHRCCFGPPITCIHSRSLLKTCPLFVNILEKSNGH